MKSTLEFRVQLLHKDVKNPVKAHPRDSGFDVFAYDFKKAWVINNFIEETVEADARGIIPGITETVQGTGGETPQESRELSKPACVHLNPGERVMVGLGFKAHVHSPEPGKVYELQARPRSGKASKTGLLVSNTPGTVDDPYRGEVCIFLTNTSAVVKVVTLGEAIAQLVPAEVPMPELIIVDSLDETDRGSKGFGSSGN